MERWIALLVVLPLLGCSGEPSSPKAPAAPTAEPQPAPAKTETKKPEPTPSPEPSPAKAGAKGTIDCGTLFTAADLHAACGAKGQIDVTPVETGSGVTTCNRKMGTADSVVVFMLGVFDSEAAAQERSKSRNGKPALSEKDLGRNGSWKTLTLTKGRYNIEYRSAVSQVGKHFCDPGGLEQLAKLTAERLP